MERHIRSFASRQGRLSEAQRRALNEVFPRFDWRRRPAGWMPDVVEIGFGNGEALLASAIRDPATHFLGIEVYPPGVGFLLSRALAAGVQNLRIAREDAILLLPEIPSDSIGEFRLWFPDPWPKKRHHKRRIVQPAFVSMLTDRLRPGGRLHFATDVVDYAEQMLAVLSAEPGLENCAADYAERPETRPLTHFEQRGLRLGHEVRDLIFRRR
jgi:tRNA (guanine-N7-)-methyltransferase